LLDHHFNTAAAVIKPAPAAVIRILSPLLICPAAAACASARKETINPPGADRLAPYSTAVRSGNLVFLSGVIGRKPGVTALPEGTEAQTQQALENLQLNTDEMLERLERTASLLKQLQKEQKMEARKNVVAINQNGDQLNTEHLIWDERREKLLSDEFVKITTKDEIIYGSGFEANQDFSKYKIFNIKGTISIKK